MNLSKTKKIMAKISNFHGISKKKEVSIASKQPEAEISIVALKQEIELKEAELEQGFEIEKEELPEIISFPINVFPATIQEIIKEANRTLNFPIDYLSVSILYAISVAIGNSHKLKIKTGWIENALLFLILVGKKGINKSHPISFAIQPILDRDRKLYSEFRKAYAAYQEASNVEGKDKSGLEKPSLKKTIVSDFTIEALTEIHDRNERGIGVYVDEIAGWFKNFERYHQGNDQEFWLSVFSGKPIISDRKSSKPVHLNHPFFSVIGSIQPELLFEIGKSSRNYNGFTDRLLFCFPDNLIKLGWSDTQLSEQTLEKYKKIIESLFEFEYETDEYGDFQPRIMEFTEESKKVIYDWVNNINLSFCHNPEYVAFTGVFSKLETYIGRFCLIFQLLNVTCGDFASRMVIELEAAESAVTLAEYFRQNAMKVHSIISSYNPLDFLTPDKLAVYQKLPDEFQRDKGLTTAMSLGMKRVTYDRFINDRVLFKKIKQGNYSKLY